MPPRKEASMASAKETFAALTVGKKVEVYKTVGETDIYLFAGITGDFARNHVDEEFMRRTRYGGRDATAAPSRLRTSRARGRRTAAPSRCCRGSSAAEPRSGIRKRGAAANSSSKKFSMMWIPCWAMTSM